MFANTTAAGRRARTGLLTHALPTRGSRALSIALLLCLGIPLGWTATAADEETGDQDAQWALVGRVANDDGVPVANAKVEDRAYETTLAMLGPSVFRGAAQGAVTGNGTLPHRTNLVVVTDRRILWCSKSRLSTDIAVGGADSLGAVRDAEVVPARVALAKLRFTFHDYSVVSFDLPSDHRAGEFAADIMRLLTRVAVAA